MTERRIERVDMWLRLSETAYKEVEDDCILMPVFKGYKHRYGKKYGLYDGMCRVTKQDLEGLED